MRIELALGNIVHETTDAIVNAANSSLLGGAGVDGAIHAAGGPSILDECRRLRASRFPNGLPTGQAVATGAGNLRARWVIHTVGPVYDESPDPRSELASCYAASLAVGDALGARSIAFPAVSAGAYGFPLDAAAAVALDAVRKATTRVEVVRFVLFSARALDAFAHAEHALSG